MRKLRILQGPGPICGQAWALSRGLVQLGHDSKSGIVAIEGQEHNKYKYPFDMELPINGGWINGTNQFLKNNIHNFDIFHFHARSFFHFNPWPVFPTGLDILGLRLSGKKVFFHFRGSEVRRKSRQLEKNPFNYVESAPEAFKRSDEDKENFIKYIKTVCNGVFVVDREVNENVGGGTEVPICLDLEDWKFVGQLRKKTPVIVHAPSHQGIKGTEEIVNALNSLKQKGISFEYKQVEGMCNEDARKLYESADIIIDQLKMGWFGTLTVEAMALGKPVICYLREDLLQSPDEFPIVNATPQNIEPILENLIIDSDLRNRIAYRGREFAEEHHCCVKAAQIAESVYQQSFEINNFDLDLYFDLIQAKAEKSDNKLNEALKQTREMMRSRFMGELRDLKLAHAIALKQARRTAITGGLTKRGRNILKNIKNKLTG